MTLWLPLTLIIVVIFLLLNRYKSQSLNQKKLDEIKSSWGKPNLIQRNFKLIGGYFKTYPAENNISTQTSSDLDIEGVFSFIDRTSSKPGQQYLYKKLHCSENHESYFSELEDRIENLNKDGHLREQIQLQLSL